MNLDPTVEKLLATLRARRYHFANEDELQRGIALALEADGWEATREAKLSGRDRIDFLVGNIGIEAKVDSSATEVQRQLIRYAEHVTITALVLVTSRSSHRVLPRAINDKALHVVHVGGIARMF